MGVTVGKYVGVDTSVGAGIAVLAVGAWVATTGALVGVGWDVGVGAITPAALPDSSSPPINGSGPISSLNSKYSYE